MQKILRNVLKFLNPDPKRLRITQAVPKISPGAQRWVIPDIHGCRKSFIQLLKRLNLSSSDQLFLLGDYIDRGPDSAGVLDVIFELKQSKIQVFPILGNHEVMLLEANRSRYILKSHIRKYGAYSLVDPSKGQLKLHYRKFIEQLPHYLQLPDYYLVHAGFNFASFKPLEDLESMLYIRNFPVDTRFLQGRQIIHGHTPRPLSVILSAIKEKKPAIPLDNGCVFAGKKAGQGHLLAFNLNTQQMISQKNVDIQL